MTARKYYEVTTVTTVEAEDEDDAINVARDTLGCTEVRELEGYGDDK